MNTKYMDIKPKPQTNMQDWRYWQNRMSSLFVSIVGKKIEVHYE